MGFFMSGLLREKGVSMYCARLQVHILKEEGLKVNKRLIGHIGVSVFLLFFIFSLFFIGGLPNKTIGWAIYISLFLSFFHFLPVKCDNSQEGGSNFRVLGHIGVIGVLLSFIFVLIKEVMPLVLGIIIITPIILSLFHFSPVECNDVDDKPTSLVLWVTSKTMWFSKLSHINILYFIVLLQLVAISYFQIRISDNESTISDNESTISDNESRISRNRSNISDNESNISDNESNISDNESRISHNNSRINILEIYR